MNDPRNEHREHATRNEKLGETKVFSKLGWLGTVHRAAKLTPAEYRVLLEIFNRTQGDGRDGRVSLQTLSDRTGLTLKTTKSAIRKLQELDYVARTTQGSNLQGTSNVYKLGFPNLGENIRPPAEWVDPDEGIFPKLIWLERLHKGPALSHSQFRVLVEIMLCTSPHGDGAVVSCRFLMALTGLSRNTVESAIRELRSARWIELSVERPGDYHGNVYRICDLAGLTSSYVQPAPSKCVANAIGALPTPISSTTHPSFFHHPPQILPEPTPVFTPLSGLLRI